MRDNKCLLCGETIPEGRQICPSCEDREKAQKLTVRTILKMTEQQKKAVEEARRETAERCIEIIKRYVPPKSGLELEIAREFGVDLEENNG